KLTHHAGRVPRDAAGNSATIGAMSAPRAVVPVHIPGARYDVTVEPGLLSRAGEAVAALTRSRKVCVLTDSDVGPRHLPRLTASLGAAGIGTIAHTVPAGEAHKTVEQIGRAYDTFLAAKVERSTPVLALGGGVIGDMA